MKEIKFKNIETKEFKVNSRKYDKNKLYNKNKVCSKDLFRNRGRQNSTIWCLENFKMVRMTIRLVQSCKTDLVMKIKYYNNNNNKVLFLKTKHKINKKKYRTLNKKRETIITKNKKSI